MQLLSDPPDHLLSRFYVTGINYRTASAEERSQFALSNDDIVSLLMNAKAKGVRSVIVLSTCNRTEVFGFCEDGGLLTDLLLQYADGDRDTFQRAGFLKKGSEAVEHLFLVAAGADSQIPGDYEILGQLKKALALSRDHKMVGPVMDRTLSYVIQASKAVKSGTKFSNGTVSVSYAAVEWLQRNVKSSSRRILLVGAGKLGRSIARNLMHYFNAEIILINRTDAHARELAEANGLQWSAYANLDAELDKADIIIACAQSPGYLIHHHQFTSPRKRFILDLSVPLAVDPAVRQLQGIVLCGIDEISAQLQSNIDERRKEMPLALDILQCYRHELYKWMVMQRHVPLIKDMRDKLKVLVGEPEADKQVLHHRINRAVSELAENLRERKEKGCLYINAMHNFLQPGQVNE